MTKTNKADFAVSKTRPSNRTTNKKKLTNCFIEKARTDTQTQRSRQTD